MTSARNYDAPVEIQEEEEPAAPAGEARGDDGLSHHGDPGGLEVGSQEESTREPEMVRAPREPTQKEREAHETTHLPHAEWCD